MLKFPDKIVLRHHAARRMLERRISLDEIKHVLKNGEVIEEYPGDKPYPSFLVLGFVHKKPLHLVLAVNIGSSEAVVVTVYQPNPHEWSKDFRERKK